MNDRDDDEKKRHHCERKRAVIDNLQIELQEKSAQLKMRKSGVFRKGNARSRGCRRHEGG